MRTSVLWFTCVRTVWARKKKKHSRPWGRWGTVVCKKKDCSKGSGEEEPSGKVRADLPSLQNKRFLTTPGKTLQQVKQLLHQNGDLFHNWILFQKF